uniref:PGG domain-containing protein n=1 Tax=Fagus sylvatica TaxID=28930 RepID=A0A2N9GMR6_FAGSY
MVGFLLKHGVVVIRWLGLAGVVVVGFSVDFRLGLGFCRLGFLGFAAWAWVLPVGFSGFCRLGFGAWRAVGLGLEVVEPCRIWLIHGGGRGGFWLLWVDLRWWWWRRCGGWEGFGYGCWLFRNSPMGKRLLFVRNKNGQTPDEVFTESHADLVKQGEEWLIKTSQACSVVAGLFVTVAFSTSTTVPEGIKQEKFSHAGIQNFRRIILCLLLHFIVCSDHVPFNSHIRVQRKRFPPRLTMEAFAGFISILPVYSNYLDMFHNSTFLHLQGSTDIYIFLVICNDLPAVNSLCYVSVSALLSFGVGYLYECATT